MLQLHSTIYAGSYQLEKASCVHLEPDILEREVKWALESITTNKAKADRKSTRLNSSHTLASRMPSSA